VSKAPGVVGKSKDAVLPAIVTMPWASTATALATSVPLPPT
jgi:hypothetical protein